MTWEAHAACRPELKPPHLTPAEWTGIFYPPQGGPVAPALAVCARCPVTAECEQRANATPFQRDGIWGGTTGRQRRASRRGWPVAVPRRTA
jgi:WhiB family redox-sensing transcriptional regulator